MQTAAGWMERHQVALSLTAIAAGALLGLLFPVGGHLEGAITPLLAGLLYATFLAVPFERMAAAARDLRFVGTLLVLNFAVAPIVAFALSRFTVDEPALLIGALLALLTPCVDYVIVFAALAGGAHERLLAASPVLMAGQMLLLPPFLWIMAGPSAAAAVELGPFVEAFFLVVALPLAAAVATRLGARLPAIRAVRSVVSTLTVPLMMATLAVVVASQIGGVAAGIGVLAGTVPLFLAFAAIMTALGMAVGRVTGIDAGGRRALLFSGVTRNSLVVLPLALALPPSLALAPLVVVTQTLVELVVMVVLVRLVPRLVPHSADASRGQRGAE